jgi:DNA-binding transcriptional ArsR family regulator
LSTVLKIHFTTEDLARTTFLSEPAPLLELKLALITLHRRVRAPRLNGWRRAALARFPESARPLWDLAAGFSGAISTTAVSGDMDQALEVARGLSREEAVREARIWFGDGAVPSWGRDIVAGDRDLARNLTRALSGAYAAVLQPHWSAICASYHTEVDLHARRLVREGTVGMLTNLVPGGRWRDSWLEFDSPHHKEVHLQGRGLALAPTAFWWGPPLLAGRPDQAVVLVYPTHSPAHLQVEPEHDPLAGILGSTRAAVLRLVRRPTVTKDIAHLLGISLASASEHASALRAAGLVVSQRDGKAVLHHATPLGLDLINANSQRQDCSVGGAQ